MINQQDQASDLRIDLLESLPENHAAKHVVKPMTTTPPFEH